MSKSKRTRRPARPLLIAGGGLAAIMFGGNVACGGGPIAGLPTGTPGCQGGCGFGVNTTGTTAGDGSTGTTGTAVQYCGVPDGGTPIPCYPDGGPVNRGDGTTGSGSTT